MKHGIRSQPNRTHTGNGNGRGGRGRAAVVPVLPPRHQATNAALSSAAACGCAQQPFYCSLLQRCAQAGGSMSSDEHKVRWHEQFVSATVVRLARCCCVASCGLAAAVACARASQAPLGFSDATAFGFAVALLHRRLATPRSAPGECWTPWATLPTRLRWIRATTCFTATAPQHRRVRVLPEDSPRPDAQPARAAWRAPWCTRD